MPIKKRIFKMIKACSFIKMEFIYACFCEHNTTHSRQCILHNTYNTAHHNTFNTTHSYIYVLNLFIVLLLSRCLCELAKQIGFSEQAQEPFELEHQLSTFRHVVSVALPHKTCNILLYVHYGMQWYVSVLIVTSSMLKWITSSPQTWHVKIVLPNPSWSPNWSSRSLTWSRSWWETELHAN